ncbi:MAG: PH domain-containing protein [Bacteroidales bacterium]|nr:PH domain-containing protein [Bacteroidales bacterium]
MKTNLKSNEQVVLLTREHGFVLVLPVCLFLLGLVIGILIGTYGYLIPIVLLIYFIYSIFLRRNNLWVVTNLRVINEYGVFSHNSKESPLEKINNVSYHQSLIGRIFGFGDVQIQTAAEMGETTYYFVQKPRQLKDTITQMQEEFKKDSIIQQAKEFSNAITNNTSSSVSNFEITSELEKWYNLKQKGILTEEEYNNRKKKLLDL